MSKRNKKRSVSKTGPVWRKSAEEATLDMMPKYNAHLCGTGPHGDAKYNRAKQKRAWQNELRDARGPHQRASSFRRVERRIANLRRALNPGHA